MVMKGTSGSIFAIGDCTATSYAPTAQVASQQGAYLARILHQMAKRDSLIHRTQQLEKLKAETPTVAASATGEAVVDPKKKIDEEIDDIKRQLGKVKLRPFHYSHQGSLAYIGSDKAIADLPFMNGNVSGVYAFLLILSFLTRYYDNFHSLQVAVLLPSSSGEVHT